jgi:preprotein translocase subunit SecF
MSIRIMLMLFPVIATTLMGMLLTVALVAGYTTGRDVMASVGIGFVLSIPTSWFVARAIVKPKAR